MLNPDTAEYQRTAGFEPVGVVSDTDAHGVSDRVAVAPIVAASSDFGQRGLWPGVKSSSADSDYALNNNSRPRICGKASKGELCLKSRKISSGRQTCKGSGVGTL